jgi:hypothetical protein
MIKKTKIDLVCTQEMRGGGSNNMPREMGPEYMQDCMEVLLDNCCVEDPSWSEVSNFASFLNYQLSMVKNSSFTKCAAEDLPGFRGFMTRFLIQMSKDFATRSIDISDESQGKGFSKPVIKDRQRWEETPHPYVFFNEDGHTVSFFGFFLIANKDGRHQDVLEERNRRVLGSKIMTNHLLQALVANKVVFNVSLDTKTRTDKLADLCAVLGVKQPRDVDSSYELTTDNVMKIMAIWMRFKCSIPVIIMGETGCGKTRLIRFMCDLLKQDHRSENMLIMKMHGGITDQDVFVVVKKAIERARVNWTKGVKATVLFFDEANTTDSIATVKAIMCDRLVDGVPIPTEYGLQFVAAVNPYREHTQEMIKKLENAGLGYHIKADQTSDAIGRIPLRRYLFLSFF